VNRHAHQSSTALVVTEESLPPSKLPFSNYQTRRIVAHAKNAKAPIKAAIHCVIQERWAAESTSMLGWRVVNGKKVAGFKAFTDLRPFIVATINEVSLLCVSEHLLTLQLGDTDVTQRRKNVTQ